MSLNKEQGSHIISDLCSHGLRGDNLEPSGILTLIEGLFVNPLTIVSATGMILGLPREDLVKESLIIEILANPNLNPNKKFQVILNYYIDHLINNPILDEAIRNRLKS